MLYLFGQCLCSKLTFEQEIGKITLSRNGTNVCGIGKNSTLVVAEPETCTNRVETNKYEVCKAVFGVHIFLQLFLIRQRS